MIGDGSAQPDGEVAGLEESDLLGLYRDLVLLRTYDERSLVYHRQGRIGTYAIFWGHEAMQVGRQCGPSPMRIGSSSYRESAIGLLRGMPPETVLAWWRGHPAGWWTRGNTGSPRSPSRSPRTSRTPSGFAWGKRLLGESASAIAFFGDGATSEGRFTKVPTSLP